MAPTISKTTQEAADQITRDGDYWGMALGSSAMVTYGYRANAPNYDSTKHTEQSTFQRFTSQQIDATEDALDLWSDLANITFTRVGSGNSGSGAYTDDATVLFATYSNATDEAAGFGFGPGTKNSSSAPWEGDVWFNRQNALPIPQVGHQSFETLLHEIGHALGLDHPGNYNAGSGVKYSYEVDALYKEDSKQYSVMSYFDADKTGAEHHLPGSTYLVYSVTPMLHDIAAIQKLYGANTAIRTDNTVYGFNSTAGRDVYRLDGHDDQNGPDFPVFTIWDAGGNDTLDVSGYVYGQVIDLRPNRYSSIGGLTNNVAMAATPPGMPAGFDNLIENGIGGGAGDSLFGNDADNRLEGNDADDVIDGAAGDDRLSGGNGNDDLYGGDGTDTAVFARPVTEFSVTQTANGFTVANVAGRGEGTDQLEAVEFGEFAGLRYELKSLIPSKIAVAGVRHDGDHRSERLPGSAGDDAIYGNGGHDIISGEAGNDSLIAGSTAAAYATQFPDTGDQLDGGAGDDAIGGSEFNDIIRGGLGQDYIGGGAGDDTIDGGAGRDKLLGEAGDDVVDGGADADELDGGVGADTLRGGAGTDVLVSGAAGFDPPLRDRLYGGADGDTLIGGSHHDEVFGEGGDDILTHRHFHVQFGVPDPFLADTYDGGLGIDLLKLDFTGYRQAMQINFAPMPLGGASLTFPNGTTAASIELLDLVGGDGDDHIMVKPSIRGASHVNGGHGNDTVVADFSELKREVVTDKWSVIRAIPNTIYGGVIELTVTAENVTLLGGSANDVLAFTLLGSKQTLQGNGGADRLSGGDNDDRLEGGTGDDLLQGGAGMDVLLGGQDQDRLIGGKGADTLNGGAGIDVAVYSGAPTYIGALGVEVDLAAGRGSGGEASAGDILSDIEDVIGSALNDRLTGDGASNTLTGKWGHDRIEGGGGLDTAVFDHTHSSAGTPILRARSDYHVRTFLKDGALNTAVEFQVPQTATLAPLSPTDVDTLTGIEVLRMGNSLSHLAGAQLNRVSSIDGDRFDDVVLQNRANGQIVYAKMADGVFQSWKIGAPAVGPTWKAIATGDVNPSETDGSAEIFIQHSATGTIYYAGRDTSPLTYEGAVKWGVVSSALSAEWKLRTVADVNGDAAVDAIVQHAPSGTIYYADMRGGAFNGWGVVSPNLTPDWLAAASADVNRDGFADVIVQQQSTGTIYYASMANGQFSGWGVVAPHLTPDWKARAAADVTGDGFADVIVQQSSTGTTFYADMANGQFTRWGIVAANLTAEWTAERTADVDNDGHADVLFQHAGTGTTYYAEVNGAGLDAPLWGVVAANVNAEWQVV